MPLGVVAEIRRPSTISSAMATSVSLTIASFIAPSSSPAQSHKSFMLRDSVYPCQICMHTARTRELSSVSIHGFVHSISARRRRSSLQHISLHKKNALSGATFKYVCVHDEEARYVSTDSVSVSRALLSAGNKKRGYG